MEKKKNFYTKGKTPAYFKARVENDIFKKQTHHQKVVPAPPKDQQLRLF